MYPALMHGQARPCSFRDRPAWCGQSPDPVTAYRRRWEECFQPWSRSPSIQRELEEVGFSIVPGALTAIDVDELLQELPWLLEGGPVTMERQNKGKGGHWVARTLFFVFGFCSFGGPPNLRL